MICAPRWCLLGIFLVSKNLTGTSATDENVLSHWTDFWVHVVIYYYYYYSQCTDVIIENTVYF